MTTQLTAVQVVHRIDQTANGVTITITDGFEFPTLPETVEILLFIRGWTTETDGEDAHVAVRGPGGEDVDYNITDGEEPWGITTVPGTEWYYLEADMRLEFTAVHYGVHWVDLIFQGHDWMNPVLIAPVGTIETARSLS